MSGKEQIAVRARLMQQRVKELERIVEKYRQETEYVCLKTGVQDWLEFLAEIRMGKIARQPQTKEAKGVSAIGLLQGIFGSSNRSTARQHFCECESPICSEGSVRQIRGSDTSRSQSTPQETMNTNQALLHDPFEKYKLEELIQPKEIREESIEQILKYIEKYEAEKAQPIMQGFDTFRKMQKDQALNETHENNSSEKAGEELTASSERLQQLASGKQESHFKPFWRNKENAVLEYRQWRSQSPPKEYTLAVQNTRLRRQLKQLQAKLCG